MKKYLFLKKSLLLWALFLLGLSHISGYQIGAVKSFNWDIALMLTPYGILKNMVFSETYLTPYYQQSMKSASLDNAVLFYALLFVHLLFCLALYLQAKRKRAFLK